MRQITVVAQAAWVLFVHGEGGAVVLKLVNPEGAVRGTRKVAPSPADCPALPDSVALLAQLWIGGDLPARPPAPRKPDPIVIDVPPSAPRRAAPKPVAEPPLTAPPTVVAEVEAAPAAEAAPPTPVAIREPTAFEVVRPEPSGRSPSVLGGWWLLGCAGGAFDGRDGVASGGASIERELFDAWAIAIEAGLQSDRVGAASPGSVAVSVRWAALTVRRFFFDRLGVSAGVQAVHFHASPRGYSDVRAADVASGAGTLQVEWRQPIGDGLYGVVRAEGLARLAPQAFSVVPYGRVITVPGWSAGATAGFGYRFR